MSDIIGPANAVNSTTVRPYDGRVFGATDTWMKDCSSAAAQDGTQILAAMLNQFIGHFRAISRSNGLRVDGITPVVTLDNADDMPLRAIENMIQRGALNSVADSGSANNVVATLPLTPAELVAGMPVSFQAAAAPTGASTLIVTGFPALPIKRRGGLALTGGEWSPGDWINVKLTTTGYWQLQGVVPSDILALVAANQATAPTTAVAVFTASTSWTVPAGVTKIKRIRVWGAGGGGGGSNGSAAAASAGGGGAFYEGFNVGVTPGQIIPITVGTGGAPGASTPGNGNPGSASSFGSLATCTGGGPGYSATGALQVSGQGAAGVASGSIGYGINGTAGGLAFSAGNPTGGLGGSSPFGGSVAPISVGAAGNPGQFPGGGANGGSGTNPGGRGADGLVIIEY